MNARFYHQKKKKKWMNVRLKKTKLQLMDLNKKYYEKRFVLIHFFTYVGEIHKYFQGKKVLLFYIIYCLTF